MGQISKIQYNPLDGSGRNHVACLTNRTTVKVKINRIKVDSFERFFLIDRNFETFQIVFRGPVLSVDLNTWVK